MPGIAIGVTEEPLKQPALPKDAPSPGFPGSTRNTRWPSRCSHSAAQTTDFARHARKFGFLASLGSDYHGPGESYVDLGGMPPLPLGLTPVWQDW